MKAYNVYDKLNELNLNQSIKLRARHSTKGYYLQLEYYNNSNRMYTGLKLTLTGDMDIDRPILDEAIKLRDYTKYNINPFTKSSNSISNTMIFKDYYLKKIEFKSIETKRYYIDVLNVFLRFSGEKVKLIDITEQLVRQFIDQLTTGQNTKKHYLDALKHIMNYAVDDDLYPVNPLRKIHIKKLDTTREFLTIEEIQQIKDLGHCHNEDVKKAFLFCCFTGIRRGDVYDLKWTNIKNGILSIRMNKTKDIVTVKLNKTALDIINSIEHKNEKVFQLPVERNLRYNLADLLKSAGITKNITWHCSRHSFCYLLLASGVDVYDCMHLMGHKDISTTMVYAHSNNDKLHSAIDRLPAI